MREVSAEFQSGRLYAILGENGAGKSTLLRVIAGLAKPSRGDVSIAARDNSVEKRAVGYMAHASLLYEELSGAENLRYFAGLYGVRDNAHCEELMRRVGLDPRLNRRLGDYSQGMKQRLSLARAIIHDPAIALFDEPFSNLDAASFRHIAALLADMRSAGKCVIVVTHQSGLLQGIADESLRLEGGRVAAHETGIAAARSDGRREANS